ncbi:PTS lactose transporter subunit IIC [Streptomyces sp. WAC05374]|uniref:PTS fructose transporter subunit IIABC n=1 Tax=Streptomyces sp. WAC05374 TaxID=2487420 RepID=UPI000F89506D|nr:fructose-specific PTS transporter subunit EIIC [Streptomyces sp. WAC05374]RST08521.1 PTS lactose transporter subunit IIC [Streptomyces sp. WAC05374]TDF47097.1 PTS lactose transporter subunit IIC [Streptomyces sp. WAC05374]TDF57355.1 PTS lactose transporter subunit IIC [Streptomyces sp. WAC05374]TDF61460.1 PTS lactose transporter subunit IIC [Streptomyces sp. WAC05374]
MSDMITADLVDLDLAAHTKEAAARSLAERMVRLGRVTDLDGFLADVAAREAQMPTGLDGGIGIPHCRSAHVTEPTLAFGRSGPGIDFGAPDGPADLIFLIAAPAGADDAHLTILSSLARRLMDPDFTSALRTTASAAGAAALVRGDAPPPAAEAAAQAEAPAGAAEADTPSGGEPPEARVTTGGGGAGPSIGGAGEATGGVNAPAPFRVVAVTSCPTGIAHTYMAAESLESAGRDAGVEVAVETQGSAGFTRLDPAVIAAADGVILAHDVPVREKERFAGKPTVDVGVKAGINRAAELIADVRAKAERGEVTAPAAAGTDRATPVESAGEPGEGYGTKLRKWLMSGVSYMVPFVAAGGLLIALGFAIGGYTIDKAPSVAEHFAWGQADSWAALLFQIGGLAFSFLIPVLAGYIAYGMADRPGLVPGFVGGAVALTIDAGFLGGLAAGLVAGGVVRVIQRVRVPGVLRGIMPVVVIPLVSSLIVGFLMFLVIGKPIASLQSALTDWLSGLSGANAVVLGMILGLMMCFDLGGPLNKVAYAFAIGGLASPNEGSLKVMAAVMAAGMVPPLAMALATVVRGKLFTRAERENGKAAWVLGASFITEGAIPFAAADPLRVIPSAMVGGAVTGALSMLFECTLRAPHGGVFVVPLIGNPALYLVAIALGTLVSATLVVLLKGHARKASGPAAVADEPGETHEKVTVAA